MSTKDKLNALGINDVRITSTKDQKINPEFIFRIYEKVKNQEPDYIIEGG